MEYSVRVSLSNGTEFSFVKKAESADQVKEEILQFDKPWYEFDYNEVHVSFKKEALVTLEIQEKKRRAPISL